MGMDRALVSVTKQQTGKGFQGEEPARAKARRPAGPVEQQRK